MVYVWLVVLLCSVHRLSRTVPGPNLESRAASFDGHMCGIIVRGSTFDSVSTDITVHIILTYINKVDNYAPRWFEEQAIFFLSI